MPKLLVLHVHFQCDFRDLSQRCQVLLEIKCECIGNFAYRSFLARKVSVKLMYGNEISCLCQVILRQCRHLAYFDNFNSIKLLKGAYMVRKD